MTALKTLGVFSMALFLVAIGVADANAQMFIPVGAPTLTALPGVELIVDPVPSDLERHGVTSEAVRADVERRLRGAGIAIYPSQAANPSPAKAYLSVALDALALPGDSGYALSVHVQLRQTLRSPVTNSNIVNAMTWGLHNILAVPDSELPAIRAEIVAFVDQFAEDWASVH